MFFLENDPSRIEYLQQIKYLHDRLLGLQNMIYLIHLDFKELPYLYRWEKNRVYMKYI